MRIAGVLALMAVAAMTCKAGAQSLPLHLDDYDAASHLIGRYPTLRDPAGGFAVEILVTAHVDIFGTVTAASVPLDRNNRLADELRQRAVTAILGLRYRPFQRHGQPVAAEIDIHLGVLPAEILPTQNHLWPAIHDWSSLIITLSRSACYGTCPDYSVTIHGDGSIAFTGNSYVAFPGNHAARLTHTQLVTLVEAFRAADFGDLASTYTAPITDNPSYNLSLSYDGHSHSVSDYAGGYVGMPAAVTQLEDLVDGTADTQRWIAGDGTTLASLRAEDWEPRAAATAVDWRVLAANGDVNLAPALLGAGADARGACAALDVVAWRGNAGVVQSVLADCSQAHPADLNAALLSAAQTGHAQAMQVLLAQGADPRALSPDKNNLLIAAAVSGVPEAVAIAAKAGFDPNARDGDGKTALVADLSATFDQADPDVVDRAAVARLLLDNGADPNIAADYGTTALISGAGDEGVVRLLIQHGAKVNVEDDGGFTPLMNVSTVAAAQLLVAAGADPNYRNRAGKTVFTQGGAPADVLAYLKSLVPPN